MTDSEIPAAEPVKKTPPPIADGPVPPPPTTLAAWEALVADFESTRLPWSGWRHPQHLAVTTWYLLRDGLAETERALPGRIRAFNASHGVETTLTRGYHETMTRFWLLLTVAMLERGEAGEDKLQALARVEDELAEKELPFQYYSRDRLLSWEARQGWLAPDLKPL